MTSTRWIFQKSMPLFAVVVTFFVLVANISGYGILSVFATSLLMIISLSHIAFTPKKQIRVEGGKFCDENQDSSSLDDQVLETVQEDVLPVDGKEDEQCVTVCQDSSLLDDQVCRTVEEDVLPVYKDDDQCVTACQADDLYSESESADPSFTSEDSDMDWRCSCIFGQSPECSDDSISDEESLIEIAIPSGHYLCPKESTFLAKMNEMNEEDNLIEIDLSMGSIKCSRFEIQA